MAISVKQQPDVLGPSHPSTKAELTAEVITQSDAWSESTNLVEATIQKAVACVAALPEVMTDRRQSVSIVLSDDDLVRQLNKTHRGFDKPTNVLSFPSAQGPFELEEEGHYLGDVVLAFETIEKEANDLKRSKSDHLSHLVIHGLLHLLGYDHETDQEARLMEQLEISLLANLGIANPYEDVSQV